MAAPRRYHVLAGFALKQPGLMYLHGLYPRAHANAYLDPCSCVHTRMSERAGV